MQFSQSAAIEQRESQTDDIDSYWTLSTSISVDFLIREYDRPTALQKQDFVFSECLNCTKFIS